MLPSSHLSPMNASVIDNQIEGPVLGHVDDSRIDGNYHPQDASKDKSEMQARSSAVVLADAFSEFILACSRLEKSYFELQREVYGLGLELAERNAALNTSLAENERMRMALQQIVDSMPCGVLVVNCDGEISIINPESERMLGLDSAHFQEGSPTTLQQISAHSGINLELSYEGELSSATEQEFCISDSSGKRWLGIRNRRLFHQPGRERRPDQTILILRDITAHKRAEREREAGRNAMALAEIATILAHEIRNPLASLELFAELIEQDGDRRSQWISNLRAGIRSLSGTVNNVLTFHGPGSLKLAPVRLAALIGNAIQFVQPLADQAAVSLQWSGEDGQPFVMGNESALKQVFLNLVSNAIRHTPAGGSVTVSLRTEHGATKGENYEKKSDYVVVEFSDTGCGIRPDQIDRIFQPGFSGSGDTSGLGLAVCASIMKQHGGGISASNGVHSGARFLLDFPTLLPGVATA
jgi:two-component system sensor histidine kinase FlrB